MAANTSSPVQLLFRNRGTLQGDQLQEIYPSLKEKSRGIRVFYFSTTAGQQHCDHGKHHNQSWKTQLEDGRSLEAGTVITLTDFEFPAEYRQQRRQYLVVIQWDCGFVKAYSKQELDDIRVFDLGPTGYKGEMIICDKCLLPVMGFAWRLVRENGHKLSYDLCFTHYNENEDPYSRDQFYCIIPSGDITSDRAAIEARSGSDVYNLIGLFKEAEVEDLFDEKEFEGGKILKIEHKNRCEHAGGSEQPSSSESRPQQLAQQDLRYAKSYNCCAEIIPSPGDPLIYRSVGAEGVVDVKVTSPGTWGPIFASHHPLLSFELLWEISTYEDSCLYKMSDGNTCFVRKDETGKCHSMTVCGTDLKHLSDKSVWEKCKHLSTVILYMNELSSLPDELLQFKKDIRILCIMHNHFTEFPEDAYNFTNLEDLAMHGNYLSSLPEDIKYFSKLTRLYLGSNDLVCLPDVFDWLPALKKASFCDNFLSRLPPSFSKLRNLKSLDISNNAIGRFPVSLLDIKSLLFLNIERNRIQRFTEENSELYDSTFSFLKQLAHFQFKGNPICQHERLRNIVRNHDEVLEVLTSKEVFKELSEVELTRSLRVNVLGEVGSGKTSLVQAFTREKYVLPSHPAHPKDHRHTVGIDRYSLPVQIGGKTILLQIWDHAGDDEYAMMNDLFISNKSLVWLVVNLEDYQLSKRSKEEDQHVFMQHIGNWLLQVMLHNLTPVVWIVCTHVDSSSDNNRKIQHMETWTTRLCQKVQSSLTSKIGECSSYGNGHQSVPQYLNEHYKVMKVSNTYSFDGLQRLYEELGKLPEESGSVFADLTSPLPVQWERASENLKIYAENELLAPKHIPAIRTASAVFDQVIHQDSTIDDAEHQFDSVAFLQYLHDTGDIYWLRSSDEKIAVVNVDWMINLLKQVYHLKFNDELQLARNSSGFADIPDVVIEDCFSMRTKFGLIAEAILKPLWKCSDQSELFVKITELFQKFNLTYPVMKQRYGALQTFFFFPHLTTSVFPSERDSKSFQKSHITLRFTFKFFFPKFFLQRLALQFWQDNDGIKIYEDGFKTKLANGIILEITRMETKKPNSAGMKIFIYYAEADALWAALLNVFNQIHSILTSYWKFRGNADISVVCPKCVCSSNQNNTVPLKINFIPLMQFDSGDFARTFRSGSTLLCCEICHDRTSLQDLVPSTDLNFSELCDFVKVVRVTKEIDFTSEIPSSDWKMDCDSGYSPQGEVQSYNRCSESQSELQSYSRSSESDSFFCVPKQSSP